MNRDSSLRTEGHSVNWDVKTLNTNEHKSNTNTHWSMNSVLTPKASAM